MLGKALHMGTVVIGTSRPVRVPAPGTMLTLSGQQSVRTGGWLQTSYVAVKGPSIPPSCPTLGWGPAGEFKLVEAD